MRNSDSLVRLLALGPSEPRQIAHITIITALAGGNHVRKYPTPEGPWTVELTEKGLKAAISNLLKGSCPECNIGFFGTTCFDGADVVGIGCEECGGMFEPKALAKLRGIRKRKKTYSIW